MKTFDVFLKDNITNMDVFLKDGLTYMDAILKDRLTYMDAIVRTLHSREILTFSDKLLIDCFINELTIARELQAATSMEIKAEVDRLLNAFIIDLQPVMQIDAHASVIGKKSISAETDMYISTAPSDLIFQVCDYFEDYKTITAKVEAWDIGLWLGNTDFCNYIGTSTADTNKISRLTIDNNLALLSDADFSGKKVLQTNPLSMHISTEKFGLFYSTLISGNTLMQLCTHEIPELHVGSALRGSGFDMTFKAELVNTISVEKFLSGNSDIQLLSSVVWMLNKYLYPQLSDTVLSCEADAAFYVRRTLADMDSYALSEFDGMELGDLNMILSK